MIVVIETTGEGRTEINCDAEYAARLMQAIYASCDSGKVLRITISNEKREIIINTRHLIKAFTEYESTL